MRSCFTSFCLLFCLTASYSAHSQTPAPSETATNQVDLLASAGTAFNHSTSFRTITLSGSVSRPSVRATTSGTVLFIANADGSGSTEIQLGNVSETENFPASGTTADCGVKTSSAPYRQYNPRRCLGSTLWYLPQVGVLGLANGDPALRMQVVDASSTSFTLYRPQLSGAKFTEDQTLQLSSFQLQLDAATQQIASSRFVVRPDERPSFAIPITVQYSDYQPSGNFMIPRHIQRYIGGTLVYDIHISSVQIEQ
jgi:hypothetical protein